MEKTKKQIYFFSILFLLVVFTGKANQSSAATCSGDLGGSCVFYCDTTGDANFVSTVTVTDCSASQVCCVPGAGSGSVGGTNTTNNTTNNQASVPTVAKNISSNTPSAGTFKYILLETLPGFFQAKQELTDLPALILAIYKFGIWTIGIAGLFMLTIGGVMYMGSAGNTSTATTAKGIITDALIGVFAAMAAYLVLYVINPDLVKLNINFTAVNVDNYAGGTAMGVSPSSASNTKAVGDGSCSPVTTGDCSVANMTTTFGALASQASGVCSKESGGRADLPSGTDICKGNGTHDPVSIGLFQINISAHSIGGLNCPSAFNTPLTSKEVKNPTLCWVLPEKRDLYNQCVAAAKNPAINIAEAKKLYDKVQWVPWRGDGKCSFY